MSRIDFEVKPTSREALMRFTAEIRSFLRIQTPHFPILEVVEVVLPKLPGMDDLVVTIGEHAEMGENHGWTFGDRKEIRLRADVYDGLWQGKGRDRFTLAHELGHLFLHSEQAYTRSMKSSSDIPPYKSAEWQANTFAGALLMPHDYLKGKSNIHEIADECGVTLDAVMTHTRLLRKSGLL